MSLHDKHSQVISYSFLGKIWKYKGTSAWYFVTLPAKISKKIRKQLYLSEEGWGRLKTIAKIEKSTWQTSIWYDTKVESYLLPIKLKIRKTEKLTLNHRVKVILTFEDKFTIFRKLKSQTKIK